MVLGRLIRSLGLVKASEEERQCDTTSVVAEGSITDNRDTGKSVDDLEDESIDEKLFSKSALLQYRSATDRQCIEEFSQSLPSASAVAGQQSFQSLLDSECICSTKPSKSIDAPREKTDKLTPTAGSWVAAMQSKRGSADPDADDEMLTRKACAILNKLTVEKFDSLFEQLATCGITKPVHLETLMREVFNKATTQHHFIAMYADLCVKLEQDSRISSVVEAAGQQHSFRRLLLNQCQVSFEKLLRPSEVPQMNKDPDFDQEVALKRKQQALGNIKLIGELLVHGVVSSKLLVECSEELLRCRAHCPEALESLAALLTTAGKHFDTESWQYHSRFVEVFAAMQKLAAERWTPPRSRFLLRDVLDLRGAGWSQCTYKSTLATTPMKLDEVRESATHEGKYISLDDRIETDNLLAGLMRVSSLASASKAKGRPEKTASSQASSTQSRPMKQKSGKFSARSPKAPSDADSFPPTAAPWKKVSRGISNEAKDSKPCSKRDFDLTSYRHSLADILADLASDHDVPAAVRRVREPDVPAEHQAEECADIISRIVEERRGPVRRCCLTFAAALAATDGSAFDRTACLQGLGKFFKEVFPTLFREIPRLPAIATSELLPTMRQAFDSTELNQHLPQRVSGSFA